MEDEPLVLVLQHPYKQLSFMTFNFPVISNNMYEHRITLGEIIHLY